MSIKSPKKLIEVALPLDDINVAAAREKSIRHGHPSTLHLWWARRPLAAARAVLFAQMVNDPGGERGYFAGKTKAQADAEREKLFQIIRDLVKWENTNNEEVLERARAEIRKSWRETCELNKGKPGFDPDKLPAFHDPFAGGGAIPLEAQRLGLESYASDLNPVAVLINKAMIEIPPKFAGRKPVGPMLPGDKQGKMHEDWSGARGLAEDVRRYGHWMREEAEKRIGHLYPKVKVTAEMAVDRPDLQPYVGEELTVIAWLWARTVRSPNPQLNGSEIPLIKSFWLYKKKGGGVYVDPVVSPLGNSYEFHVRVGGEPRMESTVNRKGVTCVLSESPVPLSYVRTEAKAGRIGRRMLAVVAEGKKGRVYLSPTDAQESAAHTKQAIETPNSITIDHWAGCTNCVVYGFDDFNKLFDPRPMTALSTFSLLLKSINENVLADGGDREYAKALKTYLAFAIDKAADYWSNMCSWHNTKQQIRQTFGRQAIPMAWDYVEVNPFSSSTGNWMAWIDWINKSFVSMPASSAGIVLQEDAQAISDAVATDNVVSTDPPYYDNVPYSNLSDLFYTWLRFNLKEEYPTLFSTMSVPKAPELVANQFRHGGKDKAFEFFMNGMENAFKGMAERANPTYPLTIYYAFKQADIKDGDVASAGWSTFLDSIIRSGLIINGTWPMRTEMATRMMASGNNALASSIVIVARVRDKDAETISRRDFQRKLRDEMPEALETMIGGSSGQSPIAPVDLAQAAIGPGMAIFSRFADVVEADGSPMSVHDALILINREITDFLTPDAGNFDNDTLFCNSWFEQFGWSHGDFGQADVLARGKGTSVAGVADAGVIDSGSGKVRLLRWAEYPGDWDPKTDTRTPIWEAAHHLIRALNQQGESEAGALLARMPEKGEAIRQLAYHLYTLCERKKWADDARAYNELITAWHAIVAASHEAGHRGEQGALEL